MYVVRNRRRRRRRGVEVVLDMLARGERRENVPVRVREREREGVNLWEEVGGCVCVHRLRLKGP